MNFVVNVSLFCVVLCVALCSAAVPSYLADVCVVPYLKHSGRLSADFRTDSPPSIAPIVCYQVYRLTMNVVKSYIFGEIEAEMPTHADCLTKEFGDKNDAEHILKIRVIGSSSLLNETEKEQQLVAARKELTDELNRISVHCENDKQTFINIFHVVLGIKNETLEAYQTYYCLAKYAADNTILDFENVQINPHNIDTENLSCDKIFDTARTKGEREVRNILSGLPSANRTLDCIVDAYKNGEAFNFQAGLIVLNYYDFPEEYKESAAVSKRNGLNEFISTTVTTCFRTREEKQ